MQNSVLKLISLAGVIGIGVLVVLEVEKSLPGRKPDSTATTGESPPDMDEREIVPDMRPSELEQLVPEFSGVADSAGGAAAVQSMDFAAGFSEPVIDDASDVDVVVDRNALTLGDDPFAMPETGTASSTASGNSNAVQTVAFEGNSPPVDEVAAAFSDDAQSNPFAADSDTPALSFDDQSKSTNVGHQDLHLPSDDATVDNVPDFDADLRTDPTATVSVQQRTADQSAIDSVFAADTVDDGHDQSTPEFQESPFERMPDTINERQPERRQETSPDRANLQFFAPDSNPDRAEEILPDDAPAFEEVVSDRETSLPFEQDSPGIAEYESGGEQPESNSVAGTRLQPLPKRRQPETNDKTYPLFDEPDEVQPSLAADTRPQMRTPAETRTTAPPARSTDPKPEMFVVDGTDDEKPLPLFNIDPIEDERPPQDLGLDLDAETVAPRVDRSRNDRFEDDVVDDRTDGGFDRQPESRFDDDIVDNAPLLNFDDEQGPSERSFNPISNRSESSRLEPLNREQPVGLGDPLPLNRGSSGFTDTPTDRRLSDDRDFRLSNDPEPLPEVEIRPRSRRSLQGRTQPLNRREINRRSDNRVIAASASATSGVLRPHLTVRKDMPATAVRGVPLTYSIVVTNEGEGAAHDIIVEDKIPNSADVQQVDPPVGFLKGTRTLQWEFKELGAGQTRRIKVKLVPTGSGMLDSVATVRFKAEVRTRTSVVAPKLVLDVQVADEIKMGNTTQLRFVARNDGDGTASDVVLRSDLPAGLRHPIGSDLEYTIGSLAPGDQREVVLDVVAAKPGDFTSISELVAEGSSSERTEARFNIVGQQLEIVRSGPQKRYVGRSAIYTNKLYNETAFEASDVVVVETVPEGMKFEKASHNGVWNPEENTVVWRLNSIPAGSEKDLKIKLVAHTAGDQESRVTVIENAGFKQEAQHVTAVEDINHMKARITGNERAVEVGEVFSFEIAIQNHGTTKATNVEMIVELPPGVEGVSIGAEGPQGYSKRDGDHLLFRYDPVDISPQDSMTFRVNLKANKSMELAPVKATIRYDQTDRELVTSEAVTAYYNDPGR